MRRLLKEPLVHFLVLGALLFAGYGVLNRRSDSAPEPGRIVVSQGQLASMREAFTRTWQRPPTREEWESLIRDRVREEVYCREAVALGLDKDDTIIRRRLQQKMEFVSEEAAALARPTDDELTAYLKANPDAFRTEPRATFSQVYLDPRKRGAMLDADAKRLLERLNAPGASTDLARLGDTLTLLDTQYENATQTDLARVFGADFADALVRQPTGKWVGPIPSGYGVHLVRVESLAPGGMPALADVRPLVEREWANAKRQEVAKAFYDKLRAKYRITVRIPDAAKP